MKEIAADGSQAIYTFNPTTGNTMSEVDLDMTGKVTTKTVFTYDNQGDFSGSNTFDASGVQTAQTGLATDGSSLTTTFVGGQESASVFTDSAGNATNLAGGVGYALGSALGSALGGNSLAARSIAGSVVGDAAGALANFLSTSGSFSSVLTALDPVTGATSLEQVFSGALSNLGVTGAASKTVIDDVDGGLANLLTAEAGQALGLKGFAGVAFTSIGGSVTTQLVKNLGALTAFLNGLTGATETSLLSGYDANIVSSPIRNLSGAGGGFLGSQLVPATGPWSVRRLGRTVHRLRRRGRNGLALPSRRRDRSRSLRRGLLLRRPQSRLSLSGESRPMVR